MYLAKVKAKKEEEAKAEKERVIKKLTSPMSKEYVGNYNISLIANSGGWIGGSYTEQDIKLSILRDHWNKFTDSERIELKKKIK